ncbi:MAG: radical SAM/SPASM domain-containing protein [Chloroflexota bacterium]
MSDFMIDGHKMLWHMDRVLEQKRTGAAAPLYLEVSPVGYCNHDCIFCGKDFAKKSESRLDADLFIRRIEELASVGLRSIMYAGEGEPFLLKELPEIIKFTKQKGIDVAVTTNGSVGSPEHWRKVLPYLTWLRFSVDAANGSTYSKVHGVTPDAFDKTLRNISNAVSVKKEMNLPVTLGAQFLIIEENKSEITRAIDVFSSLGIDYLAFKPYSLNPSMINKRDEIYTRAFIESVSQRIAQLQNSTKMKIIFRREAMEKYMSGKHFFTSCHALPYWGYVCSNGDFYTCPVFIGDERFRIGNINDTPIRDMILSDKRRRNIEYAEKALKIGEECRLNCRMSRINEFLEFLYDKPEHINFI